MKEPASGSSAKAILREEGRRRLADLSAEAKVADPGLVLERILAHRDPRNANRLPGVLAYLCDGVEIDLDPAIRRMFELEIPVAVPGVLETRGSMVPVALDSLSDLDQDRYGLRVPRKPWKPVPMDALNVVLVPGVAFTTSGHRLGRGGGYYDRLLSRLPRTVVRIGVCHAIQVVQDLAVEAHDAVMDEVLVIPGPA